MNISTYPIITQRKLVDYVLDIPFEQGLNTSTSGKNTYYGSIEIKTLYPTYNSNGTFIDYEFKPTPTPLIQFSPINKESVNDTISYYTYNPNTSFYNYYNDIYVTSYNDNLPNGTYTLATQIQTISGIDFLTTNTTYTLTFSSDIFIVRGKECYIFENDIVINQDIFIIGNGEVRILDNSIL